MSFESFENPPGKTEAEADQQKEEKKELEKGRFAEIRKVREKAKGEIKAEGEDPDRGRIRQRVAQIMEIEDAQKLERQKEITERMINRHIAEYRIGENPGCVDGVHAVFPKDGEVARRLRLSFPDLSLKDALEMVAQVREMANEGLVRATVEEQLKKLPAGFENKFDEESPERFIVEQWDEVDAGTGAIVKEVASSSDSSFFLARKSRQTVDLNRKRGVRSKNVEEFADLGQKSISTVLDRMTREKSQDSEGKLTNPFLHISVHGCKESPRNAGDLIISNRMVGGQMAADPAIARWFQERLEQKIQQAGLKRENGDPFKAAVAVEGERLSGEASNIIRRNGSDKIKPLGKLYQHFQLEVIPEIRAKYGKELGRILGEIMREFNASFSSEEEYKNYVAKNRTPQDEKRLEGILTFSEFNRSDKVDEGQIALSKAFREALGVEPGDKVTVGDSVLEVLKATKDQVKGRKPVVSSGFEMEGEVEVRKVEE